MKSCGSMLAAWRHSGLVRTEDRSCAPEESRATRLKLSAGGLLFLAGHDLAGQLNSTQQRNLFRRRLLMGLVIALCFVTAGCGREEFVAPEPALAVARLASLDVPVPVSSMTVRVLVDPRHLGPLLDEALKDVGGLGDEAVRDLSPFSVTMLDDDRLRIEVSAGLYWELPGILPDIRGRLGSTLAAGVTLRDDWSVGLRDDAELAVRVTDVHTRVLGSRMGLESMARSLSETMGPYVLYKLNEALRAQPWLADLVESEIWEMACTTVPVARNEHGEELLRVRIQPVSVRMAQPYATMEPGLQAPRLALQVGLDARIEVVSSDLPPGDSFSCPFPATLRLEEPRDGSVDLSVPVTIGYGDLNRLLQSALVGQRVGPGDILRVESVRAKGVDGAVLLHLVFSGRKEGWFGGRVRLEVYGLATPVVDTIRNTLMFTGVAVEAGSRDVLAAGLEAVGGGLEEVAEVLLERTVTAFEVDLGEQYELAGEKFDQIVDAVNRDSKIVSLSLEDRRVWLEDVQVGDEYLRVLARGSVGGLVVEVEIGRVGGVGS